MLSSAEVRVQFSERRSQCHEVVSVPCVADVEVPRYGRRSQEAGGNAADDHVSDPMSIERFEKAEWLERSRFGHERPTRG